VLNKYLSLKDAAAICPNRPHTAALWRWCRRGILSRGSGRIYLKHSRIGAQIFTTEQWLTEFFEALATADHAHFASDPQAPPIIKSTPSQREKSISKAEKELEKAGI